MSQVNKVRSQRLQELQDGNDQLFSELRKANEKYLDVRVENNKLKDQIQTLKLSVDQLRSKEKVSATRQRALSSSGGGTYTAARKQQNSQNASQQQHQQQQQVSQQADAELRKAHDILKTDTQQVCTMVKTFMGAMRALQKAVSRKQPDMTQQKRSFDSAKRELEDSVEQTMNKLLSQVADKSTTLQTIDDQNPPVKMKSVSTMRNQASASGFQRDVSGSRMMQSSSYRPTSLTTGSGYGGFGQKRGSTIRDDSSNLNSLTKQVRSLQLEKEKMKELIEELKHSNKLFATEREVIEDRLKGKNAQLHKFASQCQANSHKISMLEELLADYKSAMMDCTENPAIQQVVLERREQTIGEVQSTLTSKEDGLKVKLQDEVNRILVNLKIDPQFTALRGELTSQVTLKEKLLDQQFSQLEFRVAEKEEDLQRLKLLFVEKLRELESSFTEISHEVVETDKVKELRSLLDQKPMHGQSNLDKSMEAILSNYDNDETQHQMEELIQANHELMEQNESLKREMAEKEAQQIARDCATDGGSQSPQLQAANDNLHAEMVIELNEQIDEAKQDAEKLKMQVKVATQGESMHKKEIQGLKYDNKRLNMELKDRDIRYEKTKMDYQQQFQTLKSTMVAMKQQLQKEYDARTSNETKYLASQKQLKIARSDNQEQQGEILSLMKKLESIHSEQAYLKELRGVDSDDVSVDSNPDEAEAGDPPKSEEEREEVKNRKKEEVEQEFEDRVSVDGADAARHYFNLLKATKQEFRALNKEHTKLLTEDKKEDNLNSQLQELEEEREALKAKMSKSSKGTRLVISMQNFVRKMLQEKLEESARQLEAAGAKSKEAQAEAEELRAKAGELNDQHKDALQGRDTQMSELEKNIEEVKHQLEKTELEKKEMQEEVKKASEQENKIIEKTQSATAQLPVPLEQRYAFTGTQEELREQISEELTLKHKKQIEDMIQTYKRVQRSTNDKHQTALLTLEQKISEGSADGADDDDSSTLPAQIASLRLEMQREQEVTISQLETENTKKAHKAKKATLLMICLQNRVREMVAAKLQEAVSKVDEREKEVDSLREDLSDVTESHNNKVIQLKEAFQKEKQDETLQLIKQHETQMADFEAKIRSEVSASKEGDMQSLINKLTLDHSSLLDSQRQEHLKALEKKKRATQLVISIQNFVRNMLKDRLEAREQELQLELVQIRQKAEADLKSHQDDFASFRTTKEKEFFELKTQNEESASQSSQIDAASAQIQSLKSVQEALEREKDDLLIQSEQMEEELHMIKAELLEVKSQLEVKEMRVEELEENLVECRQTLDLNRTSELGSSGKIIHQGDDLRSLGLNSDGDIASDGNHQMTDGDRPPSLGGNDLQLQAEHTIAMLTQENGELREQVEKLRQDLDANIVAAGGRNSWDGSAGRGSWGSDQMRSGSVEEHLKHVRNIMTQFLTNLPICTKENEDILNIVYSMLNFPREEIDSITEQRTQLSNTTDKGKKGGMFGAFGKKK